MITGKTSQGYEFSVDSKTLSDWKFVKAIRRSESKNQGQRLLGVMDLIIMLLGEDQADELSEKIADKNGGHASIDAMYEVVVEILNICKEENEKIKK